MHLIATETQSLTTDGSLTSVGIFRGFCREVAGSTPRNRFFFFRKLFLFPNVTESTWILDLYLVHKGVSDNWDVD